MGEPVRKCSECGNEINGWAYCEEEGNDVWTCPECVIVQRDRAVAKIEELRLKNRQLAIALARKSRKDIEFKMFAEVERDAMIGEENETDKV